MCTESLHINSLPLGILNTVFGKLGPKELCRSSAVCTHWHALSLDKETDRLWRKFFSQRWAVRCDTKSCSWQKQYGRKVQNSWVWHGRFQEDSLYGHKGGVRCIKLLPERNLLATGSLDRTVRLWDLEAGLPIASSKLHGGTVRCLAVANDTILSGSTDAVLRAWDLSQWCQNDLPSPKKLHGHTGPISGLSVVGTKFFSGSWDCSVRLWSLLDMKCKEIFTYEDWVWSLVCRNDVLVVAAGKDLVLQDVATGKRIYRASGVREKGHVSCLEATQDGRHVFSGAADGIVQMHDTRAKFVSRDIWRHGAGVSGMAFEDPWIASCSHDGTIALLDLQKKLHANETHTSGKHSLYRGGADHRKLTARNGPVYCVDMCSEWLACGSESSVVKNWDFRGAEAAAARLLAQRNARRRKRTERQVPKQKVPCIESSDSEQSCVKGSCPDSADVCQTSGENDDLEQPLVSLIPPSELLPHGCRFESQVYAHGKGGESMDDGDILGAYI